MGTHRLWRYVAEDDRGAVVKGAVSAPDADGALSQIKAQGLAPIDLDEDRKSSLSLFSLSKRGNSLAEKDLADFCARMADLLTAGVPASKALSLIAEQPGRRALKDFAARLQGQIRKGQPLSEALAQDPARPPRIMIALTASGEALGDLGGQFSRLAAGFEARAALRKELIGQLIYPAALFVLIMLTLVFLSFFVLPQFETVFITSDASPPPETLFVLAAGAFIRTYWLSVFLGFVVARGAAKMAMRRYRRRVEAAVLQVPVIGSLAGKIETARYCRSLGELLCGGMPLARAMPIARAAISNGKISDLASVIENDVRNGTPLSKAVDKAGGLHKESISFFELGEETGNLGVMTSKAADYFEQHITVVLKRFAALSGPIMTAIMGLMTAGVIAAVMAGVLSLNETVY